MPSYQELLELVSHLQRQTSELNDKLIENERLTDKTIFLLTERKKELNLLIAIIELLSDTSIDESEAFYRFTNLLPSGWNKPDKTIAKLKIFDKEFVSGVINGPKHQMSQDICFLENTIGSISIECESEEADPEKVFLAEEYELLKSIVLKIQSYIERIERQKQNLRNETKYRQLIETINEIVFEVNKDGFLTFISPSVYQISGFTETELIGTSFWQHIHDEDLAQVRLVQERLKKGKSQQLELRLYSKSKEVKWLLLSAKPSFLADTFTGITGTLTDITGRKQTELQLRDQDLLYKSVIEASPDVITITDLQGIIIFSSPNTVHLFGYDNPQIFIGKSIMDFIHPDNLPIAYENFSKMFEGERSGAKEYIAVRADGSTFDIEVNGEFVRDHDGHVHKMVFVTRDISRRKIIEQQLVLAEESYRNMVESINDAIYEIGIDGTIHYVSPAITKNLGYTVDELVGKNFFNYMYEEDRLMIMSALGQLGQMDYSFLEYRYYTKAGELKWVRSSTTAIVKNGQIVGGRGSLSDIHERKLAEFSLRESEANFRKLIESTPVGIAVLSTNFDFILVNDNFTQSTGYTKEDLGNIETWWQVAYPDPNYRDLVQRQWFENTEAYLKTGANFVPFEAKVMCKDGKYRYFEIGYVATANVQIGSFIDITQRVTATQLLSEQVAYTDSILNALPDLMFVISKDGKIISFNSGKQEDLYVAPEHFLGKKLAEVLPPRLAEKFMQEIRHLIEGQSALPIEYSLPVNNQSIDYEARFSPFAEDKAIVLVSNISARKQAEKELVKAKLLLEQSSKMAKIGSFEYLVHDDKLTLSTFLKTMLGMEEHFEADLMEAIGTYFKGDARELVENKVKEALEYNKAFDIEVLLTADSGRKFWVRIICEVEIQESIGIRLFGAVQDIDDQKKIREEIRISEEKLSIIANNTYHWEFWQGTDGRPIYHSPSSQKITGIPVSELMALKDWTAVLIHPDDLQSYQNHHRDVRKNIDCGQHNFRIINHDGEVRHIYHVCQPVFDHKNQYIGIRGSNVDITEQKLAELARKVSEEKYRSLINSSDAAITMLDAAGCFLYLNDIAVRPYGISPESLTGKYVHELFPADQADSILKDTQSVINSKNGIVKEVLADINGKPLWFRTSMQPIIDENQEVTAVLTYNTDITETKLAEEKIKKSEIKYKTLFYDSPIGFLIIKNGVFVECNKTAETLIRGSREQLIGLSPASISPPFQANGKQSEAWAIEMIETATKLGRHDFEWQHSCFDGAEITVHVNLTVADYDGEPAFFTTWQDITEKKANETQLRKLSRAVEQSPITVVITDLDGKIEYANPAACKTTGYSIEELIGKNPKVLKSGETKEEEYKYLWNNITSGQEWRGIFHNRRKNGELYWESSTISPITNANGDLTHYIAIKEDITERKKIQENLLESEKRFRQMAQQSQTVIWEINLEGVYTYVNETCETVWGYKPEEIIGKKHFYDLHPDEEREEFVKDAQSLVANSLPFKDFENQVVRKNGQIRWMNTNGTPVFDVQNNLIAYRGADNDITDRKTAEDELRTFRIISDQANVGNAIASPDGILTYSNEAFAAMHGYTIDELIGRPLSMLHNAEQMVVVGKTIQKLMQEGGFTAEEIGRTRKDGTTFISLMNGKAIKDDEGNIKLMAASTIDITEWKKAENSLRKSEENLNNAQEIAEMGSWELNVITGEVSWSKNYFKLLGMDPSMKPLGLQEIKELVHPDDNMLFEQKLEAIAHSRSLENIYFRLKNPKNGYRWIQANIVPHFEDGKLTSVSAVSIDITSKKEAEEQIRQQNLKLNAILDAMPDLIFTSDKNGNNVEMFKSKENGHIHESIELTNSDAGLESEQQMSVHRKKISECLENAQIVTYEYPRWHNGILKYYEERIVAMENDRVLRFVRDITERKDNEREIKKLNLAIEQSPVGIVITDLEANIEYVNPAFQAITGYAAEEALGLNANILKSGHTAQHVYQELWKTITKGKPWFGEWINKRKNGEEYWEFITITPIHNEIGKITNYLAIKQDITDRKENDKKIMELNASLELKVEERTAQLAQTNAYLLEEIEERKAIEEALKMKSDELENFFSVGLDLLCIADTSGNFLKVNTAWSQILGYSTADLENRQFLEFVHPDDIQLTLDAMTQLSEQNPILEFTNRYRTKDGSYRFIEWHSVPLGNIIYAAARDITRRKRTEEFEQELLQLSTQLTGIQLSEIDNTLNMALNRIGKFLGADRAYIIENDQDSRLMTYTYEWDGVNVGSKMNDIQKIPYDAVGNLMKIIFQNHESFSCHVDDLPDDWITEKNIFKSQQIQSFILIPIIADDQIIGLVGLDSVNSKKQYTPEEINILKIWSSMLASLINDRKTENLLEQTRQNYVTFFNTIDDFLFVFNEEGSIVDMNSTVVKRLGYEADELKNQNIIKVRPEERRDEAIQTIERMLSGETDVCALPLLTKSGELIPVETRIKRGRWNGKEVIFGVSKDISQIKLSEQKFSTAFQSNAAAMAISGFYDGEYIDINNSFVEFLGFTREEMLGKTGRDMDIFVDPTTRTQIIKTLEAGNPVRKLEIKLRAKNGSVMIGLASCDSIYISQQRCMLAVIVDITERKKAEEALVKAREDADRANLAKSEFLSRMSHELRTPMNSILGFAQLLEMGSLDEKQKTGVNHIIKSGKHLLELINEVLDISRIESGRLSISIEPVEVYTLLNEMFDIVKPLAASKNISLYVPEDTTNLFVKADRQRVKQVLINLVNNAIKYNFEGGSVTVEILKVKEPGNKFNKIKIAITDTGPGIEPEDIPKLFIPFERIGAEKTQTEGTGLGLAVVKKLMDAMGGETGVESEINKGSTFWFSLPEVIDPKSGVAGSKAANFSQSESLNKNGTILYIEDNTSNIELVGQIIADYQSDITLHYELFGRNALEKAIEVQPDLILLDLNLPDIHGSEVLEILQADGRTKNIPVVIISADAMPHQLIKLLKAGAKNYITKPIDVHHFIRTLNQFLNK